MSAKHSVEPKLQGWATVVDDYVAQDEHELTVAKCSRIRVIHDRASQVHQVARIMWQDSKPVGAWVFAETANGRRGFIPAFLTYSINDIDEDTYELPHEDSYSLSSGTFMCQELSCFNLNERWSEFGLSGKATSALWQNWGKGGHDVLPAIWGGFDVHTGRLFGSKHPWLDKYKAVQEQCQQCKLCKPSEAFSRYQWEMRARFQLWAKGVGKQWMCIDCEEGREDRCTCARDKEVWALCKACAVRASPRSERLHADACETAIKVPAPHNKQTHAAISANAGPMICATVYKGKLRDPRCPCGLVLRSPPLPAHYSSTHYCIAKRGCTRPTVASRGWLKRFKPLPPAPPAEHG